MNIPRVSPLLKINYHVLRCFGFLHFRLKDIVKPRHSLRLSITVHILHALLIVLPSIYMFKYFPQFFSASLITKLLSFFRAFFLIVAGGSYIIWSKVYSKRIYNRWNWITIVLWCIAFDLFYLNKIYSSACSDNIHNICGHDDHRDYSIVSIPYCLQQHCFNVFGYQFEAERKVFIT